MVKKHRSGKPSKADSLTQLPVANGALPVISGIDVVSTVASLWDDIAIFRKFIVRFIDLNKNIVHETREAIAAGKLEVAIAQLHEVRGTGGQLGCKRLQFAAGDLEDALRSSAEDISREFAEFEAAAEEVFFSVQKWLKEPVR